MGRVVRTVESRDFSRITFHRPVELAIRGASVSCELVDISLNGALLRVRSAARFKLGDPCIITIHLDEALSLIRMSGNVAHREAETLGVRCQGLDLDSVVHLRRLLELNLGEEHLLHRELAALLTRRGR
jgi:c-di-GMP-binding flagellar brake protein YcgR